MRSIKGAIRVGRARLAASPRAAVSRARRVLKVDGPRETPGGPSFLRFAATSLSCTALDQALAALLFYLLREPLAGAGLLRVFLSSLLARCLSMSLNYTLNHRLVFAADIQEGPKDRRAPRRRRSLGRFVALSALILTLSTLGVYAAHRFFNMPEWQAKLAVDFLLFFLNYVGQRSWVFRDEVSVPLRRP